MPSDPSKTKSTPTVPLRTVLLVGVNMEALASARRRPAYTIVENNAPISAQLLSQVLPDIIVLPLMSKQSDAVTDLHHLYALGFRGRCLVLAPALPNRKMVLTELRREAYGMSVFLLDETRFRGRTRL
ncbi:MAG: hypothetical protein WBA92_00355 [Pseudorhodobacter sp.]